MRSPKTSIRFLHDQASGGTGIELVTACSFTRRQQRPDKVDISTLSAAVPSCSPTAGRPGQSDCVPRRRSGRLMPTAPARSRLDELITTRATRFRRRIILVSASNARASRQQLALPTGDLLLSSPTKAAALRPISRAFYRLYSHQDVGEGTGSVFRWSTASRASRAAQSRSSPLGKGTGVGSGCRAAHSPARGEGPARCPQWTREPRRLSSAREIMRLCARPRGELQEMGTRSSRARRPSMLKKLKPHGEIDWRHRLSAPDGGGACEASGEIRPDCPHHHQRLCRRPSIFTRPQ